jgi:hypothetical protein
VEFALGAAEQRWTPLRQHEGRCGEAATTKGNNAGAVSTRKIAIAIVFRTALLS